MDRKNINRGFKKLRVWQDAVSLYILAYKVFANFPFELKKVAANCIDASHSISRNTRPVKYGGKQGSRLLSAQINHKEWRWRELI